MRNTFFSILLIWLALFAFASNTIAQDSPQWHLPEGAKARLGKGWVNEIAYSPDGTLAVAGSIGIWLYDAQTGQELDLFVGHTDRVLSVSFSPDGQTLASGSWDETVRLWDVSSGRHLRTLTGHTGWIDSVSFSPDGNTLASGGFDETIRLWDVSSGRHLRTLTGHTDRVLSVSFFPDGRTLASGSKDGTVHLWDVSSGRHLRTLTGHTHSVESVSFAPDGNTLASSSGREIHLWDVSSGRHLRTLTGHTSWVVLSVSFAPDGRTLASDSGPEIHLWDVSSGRHLRTLTGHTHSVESVSFAPDGRTLASSSWDETVRLWDVSSGRHLRTLTGHTDWVESVSFSPDGNTLASGSQDGTVHLWDVSSGRHLRTLTVQKSFDSTMSFSPDGNTLASGNYDGTVHLWDVSSGRHLRTLTGHTDWVPSVSFSPDGRTLASGSEDETIRLWDVSSGRHLRTLTGHTSGVYSVSFSPDGNTLASSSGRGIRLWDVSSGRHLRTLTGHTPVSFSPDGSTLASGSYDATVRLWSVETGRHLRTLSGHTSGVESVSFSPDGSTLASASGDDTVRLWSVGTGRHLRTLSGHTSGVESVSFSPDGSTLASGSWDGTVLLWALAPTPPDPDITTPSLVEVADLDLSHGGDVRSVAYSPSGVVLASGGTDNTMRLWRTTNGEALSPYEHGGDVNSIAFTANGTYIATGSDDGKLRLYKRGATKDTWVEDQVFNMPGGPFSNNVKSVAFSHDNTMLACGTSGNKVYVWYYNMVSEKWENRKELSGHTGNVNSVAFSPGGVVLASASADGTVQLWRARTGELLNTLDGHTEDVNSVAFSSDDALIATGSDDDTVILWKWSASDNTWVYHQILEGQHSADVRSVAFNPSGTVLLSASADKTIGVWDGRTGDYHASLIEHDAGVINSVTYNFQGNAIAIGTDDGTVRQLIHTELTDITDKGISLTVPLDLISEVAFGTNATYFVFTAQYPILTGVADTDAYYLRCNITLDLPNVREDLSPWEYAVIPGVLAGVIPMSSLEEWVVEKVPDRTQYFMFPLKTPQERIREVSYDYKLEIAFQALGFIPILGDVSNVIGIGRTVTQTTLELYDILKSTVDPTITLNRVNYEEILKSSVDIVGEAINPINLGIVPVGGAIKTIKELASFFKVGRPDIQQRFIVILPRREEAIDIKMELTFLLRSSTVPIWFTQSYAVEYEGKWNLRDGTLAAPSAQPMSLADYPPFQELPPEVQEYLLQHFGKYVTTRDGRIPEIPETTALLPNYPNPFNPETWIPYQLAKSADVTLTIYDINGHVVRDLDLGHQRAGIYRSQSRAAHWDGRNAQGEPVASGVYFYTLKAGDFTTTRKMLIRK